MPYCKSGLHYWSANRDATRCCKGYRRELCLGDVADCDHIVGEPLPGGVRYGYCWVPDVQPREPAPELPA